MLNQVQQAGQVNIVACDILVAGGDGIDIIPQVEKITIFEDIFSPFITGTLTIRDTLDIPNAIGRQGRDLLRLHVNTPSMKTDYDIKGYFVIYKMGERVLTAERTQMFTYYFASEELVYDMTRQISKAYKGSPEGVVKDIVSSKLGSGKKVNTDESNKKVAYISNYWSPTKNIRYLVEHASPTHLFFENRDGFNFRSLEKIAGEEDIMQSFVASDFIADVETDKDNKVRFGSSSRNPTEDYTIIRELRIDTAFDYLDFIQKGGSRTKLVTHDLTTKIYDVKNFDFFQDSHGLLNKNKILRDDVIKATEPLIMTASKHYDVIEDQKDVTNVDILQKRISRLAQYQYHKIEIDTFGRTDYTVGRKVYIDINQTRKIETQEQKEKFLDKLYSGHYIVAAIAHTITRVEHKTTMELIKDSTLAK